MTTTDDRTTSTVTALDGTALTTALTPLLPRLQSLEAWTALEKSQLEAAATELKNEVTQAASRATTRSSRRGRSGTTRPCQPSASTRES